MKEYRKDSYRGVLSNANYRKSLIASLVNRFGDSIDAIASSWIVYELTGSASWSAIIFAINHLPGILVTPLAGPWVERHEKKKIMVVTDLIRALCVGVIATGLLLGFLSAPLIAVLNLVISTAEAFRLPAGAAITPRLVEKEQYGHATSLSQSLSSVTELIGTGAAGAIIAALGSSGAIYIDMLTFVASALIISAMRIPGEEHMEVAAFSAKEYFADLKGGLRYCLSGRILMTYALVALFLNGVLVPLNSLQTPMIDELFGGGPVFLSVLGVSVTVSMLAGSVIYPMLSRHFNGKIAMVGSAAGIAVFYLGIVALRPLYANYYASMAIMAGLCFLLGLIIAFGNMYIGVEMMKLIDPEYMARANSILGALCSAIVPVTAFAVSAAVKGVSVAGIFLASGIVSVLFALYLSVNPALKCTKDDAEEASEQFSEAS
jgi:DHA3 family macrolide efflux protein-like MFS transporter